MYWAKVEVKGNGVYTRKYFDVSALGDDRLLRYLEGVAEMEPLIAEGLVQWARMAPDGFKFTINNVTIEIMRRKDKMGKGYKLTNAEIICLAIKGMEPEIRNIGTLLENCKDEATQKAIESGYGETMWKFGRLLGLYKLETGVEHDYAKAGSEFGFLKGD